MTYLFVTYLLNKQPRFLKNIFDYIHCQTFSFWLWQYPSLKVVLLLQIHKTSFKLLPRAYILAEANKY